MEIINIKGEKYNYLLKTHNSQFYISDLVCDIIKLMQQKRSDAEIATELYDQKKVNIQLSAEDVMQIKEDHIRPLGILTAEGELDESREPQESKAIAHSGIFFKKTILRSKAITALTKKLTWLFNPLYFRWVLLASIIVNVVWGYSYFQNIDQYLNIDAANSQAAFPIWWYVAAYYPLAILVLLLHELGHATPAYMNGTPPKSIGFGFYLVFPVLYADVTDSWQLERKKRMVVNIGGIYMQLVINSFLLLCIPFVQSITFLAVIVNALIGLNFLTLLINCNPFFKFDGYWLFSDHFGIPNLNKKTTSYLRSLIYKNDERAKAEIKDYNTIWLKIYSFLYLAFILFIIYLLVQGLIIAFYSWKHIIGLINSGNYDVTAVFKIITAVITTIVIAVILRLRIRSLFTQFIANRDHHKPVGKPAKS